MNLFRRIKKIEGIHLYIFISFALVIEFITKIFGFYYQDYYWSFSTVLKSAFVLLFFYKLIKEPNKQILNSTILILSYLLIELIIHKFSVGIEFFSYSIRYLYFIMFLFLLNKYNNARKQSFINYLTYILLLNSILIILGICFDITAFKTYGGARIGYDGIFNVISDVNYVYATYILILFLYHRENKLEKLSLLNIIISILTGTKVIIFISLLYIVFRLYKYSKKLLGVLLLTVIISCFIYYQLFSKYFKILFKEHFIIYEKDGFWGAISSTRFTKASESISLFLKKFSDFENFIYNRNFLSIRTEMELIDLLIFWGVAGFIIYIYTFYTLNKNFIYRKKDFLILCMLLLISIFAGKFLTNFISLLLLYSFFTCSGSKTQAKTYNLL